MPAVVPVGGGDWNPEWLQLLPRLEAFAKRHQVLLNQALGYVFKG
jgi:hypothetical protein